jgi:acyl-CoA thioester hydrolase
VADAIPERADFGFFYPIHVRYAEIDAQGVVFNAHYLTYYDTAITEFVTRHAGYDYFAEVARTGHDFHLVKSLVEYKAPIRVDSRIEIGVRVARFGRTSITFQPVIFAEGGDALLASGEIVWVHTDQSSGKSAPLPEEFVRRLKQA